MALIVENGQGLPNANSYVSVADATAFAALNGLSFPSDQAKAENALIQATRYIDLYRFSGKRATVDQALDWPRSFVDCDGAAWSFSSPSGIIPVAPADWHFPKAIIDATCELASRASLRPLFTDVAADTVTEKTIGPLTIKYGEAKNGGQVRFTIVDALLAPYLLGARVTVPLRRG